MSRISCNHPEWRRIRNELDDRFHRDFNYIQHDVIKKVFDNMDFEYILNPSFKEILKDCYNDLMEIEDWIEEYFNDQGTDKKEINLEDEEFESFCEWVEDNKYDELMDLWSEREHYPMWGTLFEARDRFLSEKLLECVDELFAAGIGVMEGGEYFNTMLFIPGAGYDFYEAHWIPLYTKVLDWVKKAEIEQETA